MHVRALLQDEVDLVGRDLGLARLHQGDGFYLVAWSGEAPVGHVHLALTDPPELQDVFVVEEHRRRGIALAMTSAAEHEARTPGRTGEGAGACRVSGRRGATAHAASDGGLVAYAR